jgi:hypothetical protein
MAGLIGFSNPQVVINNVVWSILPNSFKFTDGKGDIKVRALAAGGNSVVTVHTQDKATQIGKIEFEVAVTAANRTAASALKDNIGGNVIQATQVGIPTPIIFQNCSMVNDPQWEATADGKAKLEFMGDPAVGV